MSLKRNLIYPLQAVFVYALFGFFKLLPLDAASALGATILGAIGSRLGANKKVLRNLEQAFPELDAAAQNRIAAGMWQNLGRVLGEYPHLGEMEGARVEVIGRERLVALYESKQPFIMVSGHFANWEVLPVTAAKQGLELQLIYRHANNPYVDRLLARARSASGKKLARKGVEGARSVHGALRKGEPVAMLIDQKHSRGLPVAFFGRPALTGTAPAELSLKYNAPIIPVQLERLNGAHFRLTVHEPLAIPQGLSEADTVANILNHLNALLESWTRQHPEQWLWLHRRWG